MTTRKIESLHGLIDVARDEDPPHAVGCLILDRMQVEDGVPTVHKNLELFVRMRALSLELQRAVRAELAALTVELRLAPETQAEWAALRADRCGTADEDLVIGAQTCAGCRTSEEEP